MRFSPPRLLLLLLLLPLAACVSLDDWSEAPGYAYYDSYGHAPGWYGRDVASIDLFYGSLSPYGMWRTDPRYGRVWSPQGVGSGWRPYMYGRWDNQRWISSEPFGWATYHYGRWGQDSRGWFWVPGTRYAPSWVEWRRDGRRHGWSALPPSGWDRQRSPNRWIYNAHPDRRSGIRHPSQIRPRPGQIRPDRPRSETMRPDRPRREHIRPDGPRREHMRPDRPRTDSVRPDRPRGSQFRTNHPEGGEFRGHRPRTGEVRTRRPQREQLSPERRQQMQQEWRARRAQARETMRERPARQERGWPRGPNRNRDR